MMKTPAAAELEPLGIRFQIREFDAEDLSAAEAATRLGIPLSQAFKTLVVRGDRTGVLLACVPGTGRLDLRALARASGNKRVEMVDAEEIRRLTGYLRGGVSPIGGRRRHPVYCDDSALAQPVISISAGMRGLQLLLDPRDLIRAAGAIVAPITEREPHDSRMEPSRT